MNICNRCNKFYCLDNYNLCQNCYNFLFQSLSRFEMYLDYCISSGFTSDNETALKNLQNQLQLSDVDISYLLPKINNAKLSNAYKLSNGLNIFSNVFIKVCEDNVLTQEEWNNLKLIANHHNIPWEKAMFHVRDIAKSFIEKRLETIANNISKEDEESIIYLCNQFQFDKITYQFYMDKIDELKTIINIKNGNLPIVNIDSYLYLESDEICYYISDAIKIKQKLDSGKLILTNKKLYFISQNGSFEIRWNNIMMINIDNSCLVLESTKKNNSGTFKVDDIKICYAIIDYLIKTNKRLITITKSSGRKIAQEVKTEVWQRDGGKCVECGAVEYLEFDHVIPLSKGGASSVNNLQLLCRKCNSKKSDRI